MGGYNWFLMVMGDYGVVTGGFLRLQVVMGGCGVVTGGYEW